jgi:hypothetical protein
MHCELSNNDTISKNKFQKIHVDTKRDRPLWSPGQCRGEGCVIHEETAKTKTKI